jgi:rod shape-determining protein MreB
MEIGLVTAEKVKMVLGNASKDYYHNNSVSVLDDEDDADSEDDEDNDSEYIRDNADNKEKNASGGDDAFKQMEIRGRDIVSGLPLKITITNDEIREAITETINSIVNAIKRVLERTPPELSSDIYTNGIYLSGGGALLKGLNMYIEKETGIKVFVADNPLQSVALGAGRISENL